MQGKKMDRTVRRDAPRRPGPRPVLSPRDAALNAVMAVTKDKAYAAQALSRALGFARLKPDDRRLAANLFYTCLEKLIQIDWHLDGLVESRPDPMTWDILRIAAAQILYMDRVPDHAAVDEAVKQVRVRHRQNLDKLVNAVLRSLIRARDAGTLALPDADEDPVKALSIACSVAEPAVRRVIDAYGADMASEILSYTPVERTVTVRPNLLRTDAASLEAMLAQDGVAVKRGVVPDALNATGLGDPSALPGFQKGIFSVQSEGSMLCALAADVRPGMQVLDACAAPGGKTCLMAERMQNTGRVHAWDIYPHRVELIRAQARRLGLDNVRPAVRDASKPAPSLEMSMDAVLVDAPCSGLGVMAEKPDIRFNITDEEIEGLLPVQAAILENASKCVCVGGLLVYSTCTILPEENEAQVRAFLEKYPSFEPDGDDTWLPEPLRPRLRDGMIGLLPSRDGVEGFFIARMRRRRA
ncbi:MAG: 16S rRNA (cytosine(967)-C(5))-methyltransferase RsmB [Clostridiales bacterium]|nr:16S rRNA (cytosine(967)-C(5))-methyltransferase RsmB [Clostridiales bacterium]